MGAYSDVINDLTDERDEARRQRDELLEVVEVIRETKINRALDALEEIATRIATQEDEDKNL